MLAVSDVESQRIWQRVRKEFPGNPALQSVHYVRHLLDLEWREMTPDEIGAQFCGVAKRLGLE